MSFISKFTKLAVVPVKRSLSFEKDHCFLKVRQTLIEIGLKWKDLIDSKSASISGYEFIVPKMDSIFFHEDRFEILIDVRGFDPGDITCKITPDNVEVMAQRQEKVETMSKSMSLARNYYLPQKVTPSDGNCCLSTEGILLISAPWSK